MFEGTNLLSMECRRRCPYDGSQTRVNQGNRKLLPGAKGPFKVTAVLPNDRYELHDLRDRSQEVSEATQRGSCGQYAEMGDVGCHVMSGVSQQRATAAKQ